MTNDTDGTGQGLVEFFDYLAENGLMNKSTAQARKVAATKVLGIDSDWEEIDLRELDLEQQVTRFKNLEKSNYKPNSLRTYESRFRSGVEEYLEYLDDPSGFEAPSRGSGSSSSRGSGSATEARPGAADRSTDTRPPGDPEGELISYPFPLRHGQRAYIQLPPDLTSDEAERLSRFVASLAVPEGQATSENNLSGE